MFLGKQDSEYNVWKNQNFGNTNLYNFISNIQNKMKLDKPARLSICQAQQKKKTNTEDGNAV